MDIFLLIIFLNYFTCFSYLLTVFLLNHYRYHLYFHVYTRCAIYYLHRDDPYNTVCFY